MNTQINEVAERIYRCSTFVPEIAAIRSCLVPEVAIWSASEGYLVAGRADALAIMGGRVEVAIDWKSDVNPTAAARSARKLPS